MRYWGYVSRVRSRSAAAIDSLGVSIGSTTIPVTDRGYRMPETWARSLGGIRDFGIGGTGSYGAGLSGFVCARGYSVLEVNRHNRQLRHQKGKSDPVDAESAARSVLSGQATAVPKAGSSTVEMIRHLKVARD